MAATIKDTFKINSFIQNCFPIVSCIQKFNDKIIITESVNLTLIYDLSKFFCIRSFTFTSLLPLTAPVIYDSSRDQLVAIKNKIKIDLIKNDVESDVVQSIKLDKDQPILCLLTNDNCPCLVVFENNHICELAKIIEKESIDFKDDCLQLNQPTKSSRLEKFVVTTSAINNLKFWAQFIDTSKDTVHHYVLFNYNFILNELVILSKIVTLKPDLYRSISFSSDNLLVITSDHKFKALNQLQEEFIFDLFLKEDEQLIDHGYLQLRDNISAIALLTYSKNENVNLIAYDLNLKMEMKRIVLPTNNQHQIQLNCFNSNIFVQTNQCLIYVPVQTEELSLADLMKSYKSELSFDEQNNLTFNSILKTLSERDIKPIDKEFLLVEGIEQFIINNKQELEANSLNNEINDEMMDLDNLDRMSKSSLPLNLLNKLEPLFDYRFNTEFMINQFKRKQFDREFLIKILDLLNKALNNPNCASIVRVIDWINVILDSHFICLNSSNNLMLIKHLNNIKLQTEQLILKTKTEKDLKSLVATLLLAINDESNEQKKRTQITLPDDKHLGYKLEEIYL